MWSKISQRWKGHGVAFTTISSQHKAAWSKETRIYKLNANNDSTEIPLPQKDGCTDSASGFKNILHQFYSRTHIKIKLKQSYYVVCMHLCWVQENRTLIIKQSLQGPMIAFITMINGSGLHLSCITWWEPSKPLFTRWQLLMLFFFFF